MHRLLLPVTQLYTVEYTVLHAKDVAAGQRRVSREQERKIELAAEDLGSLSTRARLMNFLAQRGRYRRAPRDLCGGNSGDRERFVGPLYGVRSARRGVRSIFSVTSFGLCTKSGYFFIVISAKVGSLFSARGICIKYSFAQALCVAACVVCTLRIRRCYG